MVCDSHTAVFQMGELVNKILVWIVSSNVRVFLFQNLSTCMGGCYCALYLHYYYFSFFGLALHDLVCVMPKISINYLLILIIQMATCFCQGFWLTWWWCFLFFPFFGSVHFLMGVWLGSSGYLTHISHLCCFTVCPVLK